MKRLCFFVVMVCWWGFAGSAGAATFESVSGGLYHSCGIESSGQAFCWGDNSSGELGDGTTVGRLVPNAVPALTDAKAISAGNWFTCAIRKPGQVVCWGVMTSGEIGNPTIVLNSEVPVPVPGLSDAVAISAGRDFACAIRSSGQAVCWGSNDFGQLGDGTTADRKVPTAVSGLSDAASISVPDGTHACATRATGQAVCWGFNNSGRLGDGTTTDRLVPTPVSGLSDSVSIAAGGAHTCAVRSTGQARCWGSNSLGELGDGSTVDSAVPVTVSGLADALSISSGFDHACAVRATGQAVCWGSNSSGQVGNGTRTEDLEPGPLVPTPVLGLSDVASLSAGSFHTCALRNSGEAECWGFNDYGQLGDGTRTDRLRAVSVAEPLPAPISGKTVNLNPETGIVKTKCPGTGTYRKLRNPKQVRTGCLIDTRRGTVRLTSARSRKANQSARFRGGLFRVGQKKGRAETTLSLKGSLQCARRGRSALVRVRVPNHRKKSSGRKLWGSGKGRFKTVGHGGSASVRGTIWSLEDRCDGSSEVKVKRGVVSVRDFARRKTVVVRAGGRYVTGAVRKR